jgi:hypothetical protein
MSAPLTSDSNSSSHVLARYLLYSRSFGMKSGGATLTGVGMTFGGGAGVVVLGGGMATMVLSAGTGVTVRGGGRWRTFFGRLARMKQSQNAIGNRSSHG